MKSKLSHSMTNPVVNSLIHNFEDFVEEKVRNFHKEEINLRSFFEKSEDGQLKEIINGIANVTSNFLTHIMYWLYNWHDSYISLEEKGIYKDQSPIKKEIVIFSPKYEIYNISYFMCLEEILNDLQKPIEKNLCKSILNSIFKLLKDKFMNANTEIKKENAKYLADIASMIVSHIASKNLNEVEEIFFDELNSSQVTHVQCNIILLIRKIKTHVFLIDNVEQVFNILSEFLKIMVKTKEKEIKIVFASVMGEILLNFASIAKIELNIPTVKNFIDNLATFSSEFLKKWKYLHCAIPLSTAQLICSVKKTFFSNYLSFLNTLFGVLKPKDLNLCRISLECIEKIVWVYLIRFNGEDKEKILKFVNHISQNIINTNKFFLYNDYTQNIIKIIQYISMADMKQGMMIISELCVYPSGRNFCSDKMALGLKAFIAIIELSQKKESINQNPGTEGMYVQNRFSTLKKALNKNPLSSLLSQPENKLILDAFYSTLWHLDALFGKTYPKTSQTSAQKYINDQSNNEKKSKLILYKQCITIIPKFVIPNEVVNQLGELLARISIHTDEDTGNCAFAVIKIIVVEYIHFRSTIIQKVAITYLEEVPQNCIEVNHHIISNIRALIQIWRTCISNENSKITTPDGFYAIEAFCLICLCTNNYNQKQMVCHLIKETKNLFIYFQQEKILQGCIYDEIFKYLAEYKNLAAEGYSNIDLLKLFEQAFPSSSWFQVLGSLLRDSQISNHCPNAIKLAQEYGYHRFLISFSVIDSIIGYMEMSSRLSLTKTKKAINYEDIENIQVSFLIYCSPSCTLELDLSRNSQQSTETDSSLTNSLTKAITLAFEKIISLIKFEDIEISEACVDVLCFTHSNVIPIFIKCLFLDLKELTDIKIDLSSRKRRRRDNVIFKILRIFSHISKNKHLLSYIKISNETEIQTIIDFCNFCRDHVIPSYELSEFSCRLIDLANIITCVCYGIYHRSKLNLIQAIRPKYYKIFITNLDLDKEIKIFSSEERGYLIEAIFSLQYTKNVFKDTICQNNIPEILDLLVYAINNSQPNNKYIILNTIEILLNMNEYDQKYIDWIIEQIYRNANDLSRQLYFILLDFYENYSEIENCITQIISLICVFLSIPDSSIYFKITKFLSNIQQIFSTDDITNFPSSHKEEINFCIKFVFNHIFTTYKKYIISIISELFRIFRCCPITYQRQIITFFQLIFSEIIFESHPDYPYTNNIFFEFPECIPLMAVKFSISIFIINNLLYLTKYYYSQHDSQIKATWIALTCNYNRNYQHTLNYLIFISHFEDENLYSLLKIIFCYINSYNNFNLYAYLIAHLKNEQNPKMRIVSSKMYPFVSINSFSYANRNINDKILIEFQADFSKSDNPMLLNNFFCLPIYEIIIESNLLSYHCALLITISHIISSGPMMIDENFITLLHLSINEMFNTSSFTSSKCKLNLIILCMVLLNSSELSEDKKMVRLANFHSLTCSLEFSNKKLSPKSCHSSSSDEVDHFVNLKKTIESIKCSQAISDQTNLDFNNQFMYKFLELFLEFSRDCGVFEQIEKLWRETCIHFATKSSSINISCYSLFVLRSLGVYISFKNLKKLIICYSNIINESFPDVKKFAHEIIITIYSNFVEYINKYNVIDQNERQTVLQTNTWFFSNNLYLQINGDYIVCYNFFIELLKLPKKSINDIFYKVSHEIDTEPSLVTILINCLFTNQAFHSNWMIVIIKLTEYVNHRFISPDVEFGLKIVALVTAYNMIDFFDPSLIEFPQYFLEYLAVMKELPHMVNFYNIFNMFRSLRKRKDVGLFLSILFPEIISGSDKQLIIILFKFLMDMNQLQEMRSVRNSLYLLNTFVDYIGSHNIPEDFKNILIERLPLFIKHKIYGKISYELSIRAFEQITGNNICPHIYMNAKFNNIHDYECYICDEKHEISDKFKYYLANNFFSIDLSIFEARIFQYFDGSDFSNDKDFNQLEMYVADIPLDYDIRTHQPTLEKQMQSDEYSIDSGSMLDDIIETIAYLEQELDKKDTSDTIKKKYQSIPSTISSTQILGNFTSTMTKSVSIVPLIETIKSNKIEDTLLSISNKKLWTSDTNIKYRDLEVSKDDRIYSMSENHSAALSSCNECIEEISASDILYVSSTNKQYLDKFLIKMPFVSDDTIRKKWIQSYLQCIHSTYTKKLADSIDKFNLINNLLPPMVESAFLRFFSVIKYIKCDKSINEANMNINWLSYSYHDIKIYIQCFFSHQEFPCYFIASQNQFINNFTTEKMFSLIMKISTIIDKIFQRHSLFKDLINNNIILDFENLMQLTDNKSLITILFDNFRNLRFCQNVQSNNIEKYKLLISIQVIVFELLKLINELVELYSSYIQYFENMLKNNICHDKTFECFYGLKSKIFETESEENIIFKHATLNHNILNIYRDKYFFLNIFDSRDTSIKNSNDNTNQSYYLNNISYEETCFSLDSLQGSKSENNLNSVSMMNISELYRIKSDSHKQLENAHKLYIQIKLFRTLYLQDLIKFSKVALNNQDPKIFCYALRGSNQKLWHFSRVLTETLMLFMTNLMELTNI